MKAQYEFDSPFWDDISESGQNLSSSVSSKTAGFRCSLVLLFTRS